jgi:hypothetical protein
MARENKPTMTHQERILARNSTLSAAGARQRIANEAMMMRSP